MIKREEDVKNHVLIVFLLAAGYAIDHYFHYLLITYYLESWEPLILKAFSSLKTTF